MTATAQHHHPPLPPGRYVAKIVTSSPGGLWFSLVSLWRWAMDHRRKAVSDDLRGSHSDAQVKIEEAHQQALKYRVGLVATVFVLAVLLARYYWPPATLRGWGYLSGAAAVAVAVFGLVEMANQKQPLLPDVLYVGGPARLTHGLITEALKGCGVGAIEKAVRDDERSVRFLEPVTRQGSGKSARFVLPAGSVQALVADAALRAFAGGLELPVDRVHITSGRTEREVCLFVPDKSMSELGSVRWGPAEFGEVDILKPFQLGVDVKGAPVLVSLFDPDGGKHGLVAGCTGSGKSVTAVLITAAAALDRRVTLIVHDLSGVGHDLIGSKVAETFRSGSSNEDIAALADTLRRLRYEEIPNRARALKAHIAANPLDVKYTGDLIAASPALAPIVVLVDETTGFVMGETNRTRDLTRAIRDDLREVAAQGRKFGISVVVCGQSVGDDYVPKGFRDNLSLRVAHRATSASSGNSYLGDGAAGAGYRPDRIEGPGVAYVQNGGGITMVKVSDLSQPALVASIARRGRVLREEAGTLSGMASGETPPDNHHITVAELVREAWPEDRTNETVAFIELLERLSTSHGQYAKMFDDRDTTNFAKHLRQTGVLVGQSRQLTRGRHKGLKGMRRPVAQGVADE